MNIFDESPAATLSFLTQQAAHIETEVYKTEYPQYKYDSFVPLDESAPEFTKVVVFRSVDARGELQLFGPNSTDVPTVDIAVSQGFHEIKTAALGYTYTVEELGFARQNDIPLDTERAVCVRDVVEMGLNKIYLLGHKNVGEGLYTSRNVSVEVATSTIASLIAAIPTQGTQPIINFFAHGYNQIYVDNTLSVHRPNTCIIPTAEYQLLARTMLSSQNSSNVTVLEFLKTNFEDVTFEDDILLNGIGTGNTNRLIWYKKDMRVIKGHDVMPLQFLAPATADNVNFKVPALTRTGGTEVRIPKALHYMDGI